jgi:hypothetical protein
MAIYTNLEAVKNGTHGIFESSSMKATISGNIFDILTVDDADEAIAVDNGVAVKVGNYTGNGLQERFGTVAKTTDKIAVTGNPAIIKDAFTKSQEAIVNYFVPAGKLVKTYEVVENDVFAIGLHQFTDASATEVKEGAFVVVDGDGAWVAQSADPGADTYGFVGQVHSMSYSNVDSLTVVRIVCVQNVQL